MNSSFLYHAWGLYDHKCSGIEYKGNTIILHIETKTPKKTCPQCGSMHLVKNGYRLRDFIGLPIGGKKVIFRMKGLDLKFVATDLSAAFISSVYEHCPNAVHVFDHFHVVKLMNEKLDDIRRVQYNMEKDINKRKVLKGTRYLLLSNGEDIFDKEYKTRLDNALAMNKPLSQAYYLKEQLREIWIQVYKEEAESVSLDWVKQAKESKVPQLMKMAATIMAHRTGILAWYDCHISTGKVEGINNKIKVMERTAYGFRDERYFKLRLYALHDCRITRNVG